MISRLFSEDNPHNNDSREDGLVELVEGRIHIFHIHVVRPIGLRQRQVEQEHSFDEPIERHDMVDLLREEVQNREGCERGPVHKPLRVVI